MPTLTQMAEEALLHAKRLDAYTASKGLPPTSLDVDTLDNAELPADIRSARDALANSAHIMKLIALGPIRALIDTSYGFTMILALRGIYHYGLVPLVPLDGKISFEDLAKAGGMSEGLCRRFVIPAIENGIFAQEDGDVKHSALSRILATGHGLLPFLGVVVEDFAPAAMKVFEAFDRWPGSGEPNETGFNVENKTDLPIYEFLSHDPQRMKRFGLGMGYFGSIGEYDLRHLVKMYPWKSLDVATTVVVDIGGGHGQVCKALAQETNDMKFIVQDLPGPVEAGRSSLETGLQGRIEYVAGDFFEEQRIVGADIYFFRWILHNWSDAYCIKILRALAPAMRKHSKVLVFEFVLEEEAAVKCAQKQGRNLDLVMLACWNGCERTAQEWKKLFQSADERFVWGGVRNHEGSALKLIEVTWSS